MATTTNTRNTRRKSHRLTKAQRQARAAEALARIEDGESNNDEVVIEEFEALGYSNVIPRETVLTYTAWQAKGRQVRKGEKSVKIETWIPVRAKLDENGKPKLDENGRPLMVLKRKLASVFHIDQTDPIAE